MSLIFSCPTNSFRTAIATDQRVREHNEHFPSFVHKWTRQIRSYSSVDLFLPESLYMQGQQIQFNKPVVAVGGTRSPSVETFCLVSTIVREMAKNGISIMSGGVPGVDLAAHLAAMEIAGGATFACLANPVDLGFRGHEWSNQFVETHLIKHGAFISEYSTHCDFGSDEYKERLLARDRIISGLSDLFIAFECNLDSATVDTALRAHVQGKQVICIDSTLKGFRRGTEQIASELSLEIFDASKMGESEILADIFGALGLP